MHFSELPDIKDKGPLHKAWEAGYLAGWDDCTEHRQEDYTQNPYNEDN